MRKLIKTENQNITEIFAGTDTAWAIAQGFIEHDIEKGWDNNWYLQGNVPPKPEPTYIELRQQNYPALSDQLDMLYWDKINQTNLWQETIAEIKSRFPKP